ncbi:unnamed protein product, partial [Nesidiocoris tenuis]
MSQGVDKDHSPFVIRVFDDDRFSVPSSQDIARPEGHAADHVFAQWKSHCGDAFEQRYENRSAGHVAAIFRHTVASFETSAARIESHPFTLIGEKIEKSGTAAPSPDAHLMFSLHKSKDSLLLSPIPWCPKPVTAIERNSG